MSKANPTTEEKYEAEEDFHRAKKCVHCGEKRQLICKKDSNPAITNVPKSRVCVNPKCWQYTNLANVPTWKTV